MQNPISKMVLELHENSHGGLEMIIDKPSSASDVWVFATCIEDTVPQMQVSH